MLKQARGELVTITEVPSEGLSAAALYVATNLCPLEEIQAYRATGIPAKDAVLNAWENSKRRWVIFKNSQPVGLLGVEDAGEGLGIPWMVGTPEMAKIKLFLCRNSAKYVEEMKKGFTKLANYVSVENKLSIGWVRWCGFTLHPPIPYGPFGYLFHPFEAGVHMA